MVRRLVGVAALTVALLVGAAAPGFGQDVTPGGGNDFGQHVAGMAQSTPSPTGADFGACVSAMARGMACPHADP
jgi:hypothetical protein